MKLDSSRIITRWSDHFNTMFFLPGKTMNQFQELREFFRVGNEDSARRLIEN